MPATAHRILFWQQKQEGIEGLLYWNTSFWHYVDDPLESMQTTPDIRKTLYGDGSLMYPGKKVGVNGVIRPTSPRSDTRRY